MNRVKSGFSGNLNLQWRHAPSRWHALRSPQHAIYSSAGTNEDNKRFSRSQVIPDFCGNILPKIFP